MLVQRGVDWLIHGGSTAMPSLAATCIDPMHAWTGDTPPVMSAALVNKALYDVRSPIRTLQQKSGV